MDRARRILSSASLLDCQASGIGCSRRTSDWLSKHSHPTARPASNSSGRTGRTAYAHQVRPSASTILLCMFSYERIMVANYSLPAHTASAATVLHP